MAKSLWCRCNHNKSVHKKGIGNCKNKYCPCQAFTPEIEVEVEIPTLAEAVETAFKSGTEQISNSVEHPKHYNSGKVEVWDFIIDQELGFLLGNVIKYVCRAGKKSSNPMEDLLKARAYLDKNIEMLKNLEDGGEQGG